MNNMNPASLSLRFCLALLLTVAMICALVLASTRTALAGDAHAASGKAKGECPALLDHEFQLLRKSERQSLCRHSGEVLLIVNTASRCGYTPQFKGLEALYQKYQQQGLTVIGFPSNDFYQELADDKAIATFCEINYGVTFPMYSKTKVKGDGANALYKTLIEQTGQAPQWNFNKYLVDRSGKVIGHFPSSTKPMSEELVSQIESLL